MRILVYFPWNTQQTMSFEPSLPLPASVEQFLDEAAEIPSLGNSGYRLALSNGWQRTSLKIETASIGIPESAFKRHRNLDIDLQVPSL